MCRRTGGIGSRSWACPEISLNGWHYALPCFRYVPKSTVDAVRDRSITSGLFHTHGNFPFSHREILVAVYTFRIRPFVGKLNG
jgi:hypothetical protein